MVFSKTAKKSHFQVFWYLVFFLKPRQTTSELEMKPQTPEKHTKTQANPQQRKPPSYRKGTRKNRKNSRSKKRERTRTQNTKNHNQKNETATKSQKIQENQKLKKHNFSENLYGVPPTKKRYKKSAQCTFSQNQK